MIFTIHHCSLQQLKKRPRAEKVKKHIKDAIYKSKAGIEILPLLNNSLEINQNKPFHCVYSIREDLMFFLLYEHL